jgi:hypothetical protein
MKPAGLQECLSSMLRVLERSVGFAEGVVMSFDPDVLLPNAIDGVLLGLADEILPVFRLGSEGDHHPLGHCRADCLRHRQDEPRVVTLLCLQAQPSQEDSRAAESMAEPRMQNRKYPCRRQGDIRNVFLVARIPKQVTWVLAGQVLVSGEAPRRYNRRQQGAQLHGFHIVWVLWRCV